MVLYDMIDLEGLWKRVLFPHRSVCSTKFFNWTPGNP